MKIGKIMMMGENMGKIIVEGKPEGSNDIETWKILDDIFSNYFKWEKYKSTEDKIYELIEQLKEESEEIGEERVKENPADYIEPPERDEDG